MNAPFKTFSRDNGSKKKTFKASNKRNVSVSHTGICNFFGIYHMRIRRWVLLTPNFLYVYDVVNAVLAVVSCGIYIHGTYYPSYHDILSLCELIVCIIFLLDYFYQLLLAESFISSLFNTYSIIDLAAVMPIFLTYGSEQVYSFYSVSEYVIFLECIHAARFARLLRCRNVIEYVHIDTTREILQIFLRTLTAVTISSEMFRVVENIWREKTWQEHLEYFDAFYFLITTITTVGYGDISPRSPPGRLIILVVIIGEVYFVPKTINKLMVLFSRKSKYERATFAPPRNSKHVIVCGDVGEMGLIEFLAELFDADHGNLNVTACILKEGPPSKFLYDELQLLAHNVGYLCGDPTNEKDLNRAAVMKASGVFFLANKYTDDPEHEDTKTILGTIAVKKYVKSMTGRNIKVFSQLLKTESKTNLETFYFRVLDLSQTSDEHLSVATLRMNLIAQSCFCPGLVTMVAGLTSSANAYIPVDQNIHRQPWRKEFAKSCDYEIYHTNLSEAFSGLEFCEIAAAVYDILGITMFALDIRVRDLKWKNAGSTILNPGSFVIPTLDSCSVYAFIIAPDQASADLSDIKLPTIKEKAERNQPNKIGLSYKLAEMHAVKPSGSIDAYPPHLKSDKQGGGTEGRESWNLVKANPLESDYISDEYLHCKVLDEPVALEEVTVTTTLSDQFPHVSGHIVVMGNIQNISNFIKPLRAGHLQSIQPIVILHTTRPDPHIWQRLHIYPMVYYVKGSGLNSTDLKRAGIATAAQAIVFSKSSGKNGTQTDHELLDADTIFTHQGIMSINPRISVLTEFIDMSNTAFLVDKSQEQLHMGDEVPLNEPLSQFASGKIYSASMLDTLLCQTIYNTRLSTILQVLISGLEDAEDIRIWNRKFAQEYGLRVTRSNLYQISVPNELVGFTYCELFAFLCKKKIVPLGLYRGVNADTELENTLPYVYTNPDHNTRISASDSIFILAQSPPNHSTGTANPTTRESNRITELDTDTIVSDNRLVLQEIEYLKESFLREIEKTKNIIAQS